MFASRRSRSQCNLHRTTNMHVRVVFYKARKERSFGIPDRSRPPRSLTFALWQEPPIFCGWLWTSVVLAIPERRVDKSHVSVALIKQVSDQRRMWSRIPMSNLSAIKSTKIQVRCGYVVIPLRVMNQFTQRHERATHDEIATSGILFPRAVYKHIMSVRCYLQRRRRICRDAKLSLECS